MKECKNALERMYGHVLFGFDMRENKWFFGELVGEES